MKKLLSSMLVLLLMLSLTITAFAAGTVTYAGNAEKFIFAPGSDESPTDLFSNFKDVMPGDSITDQIFIKNEISNNVKIKLYMRSLGAQEKTNAFLSQMRLTVKQKDDSVLFAAPANETAQLTDWTYLGTIYSGGEVALDVTLEVPITMGDEFQNQLGLIDWEFKVEELPTEPSDPEPPKTGDDFSPFLYAGVMAICLAVLIVLVFGYKRKTQTNE